MTEPRVYNVLFLCTGNSARSIMAESILNRIGEGRYRAYSAGSHPKGTVHPGALEALGNRGYSTNGLRSKSWDELAEPDAPTMDFVFTVCDNAARETCPLWPGVPLTAHWGLPDPAEARGNESNRRMAFEATMRELEDRISAFVRLPIESLDAAALKQKLEEVGRVEPRSAEA